MIYYKNKKWSKSLKSLFKTKNFENVEEIPKIQKILNKGDDVYITYNPYTVEFDIPKALWRETYDSLMLAFYVLQEEI